MTLQRFSGWWAAASLVALGLAPIASHAQVLLQPVVLELQPKQRVMALSVTLSEKATAPVRLQAELLRWTQDDQGRPLTEASNDLLVSPPIADLQPGQRQVFRVAVRQPKPLSEEASYRLILEDISPASTDESGRPRAGLSIRMRYDLPVLLAPTGKAESSVQWQPCTSPPSAEACVRVRNSGNQRIKVQTLNVAGEGWSQSINIPDGALVLAGAQREWRVPLQPGNKGPARAVEVQTSRGQSLQALPQAF
ncbi:MAG: fimbria/pilus periplasmic chaperone [Pseudomonadota bacterium]